MQEVYDFVKKCGTYYLATVDGDQPRVRPFGTIMLFEGKLYIQTGKVKDVSKQLHANPKAEICCFAEGTWLRIAGELISDDNIAAKKQMLAQCMTRMMTTPKFSISRTRQQPLHPLLQSQRRSLSDQTDIKTDKSE